MPTLSEDREAIRDLFARYALYVDSGRGDEFAGLFTEDGRFDTGVGDPLVGRDALRSFCVSVGGGSMHHMFMDQVIDIDGDTATCEASSIVTNKGQIMLVARTHDVLRRVDGQWQIADRSYTADPS
jgi:uncharacterized protein (TIGR02246 family)